MPRLTTLNYLAQRAALRREWFERHGYAFAVLSPADQILIHTFFEPTKNFTPLKLLEHRKTQTALSPTLPQRAGRAFARIRPFLDLELIPRAVRPAAERRQRWKAGERNIRVFSQVNPELDPKRFTQLFMMMLDDGTLADLLDD